MKPILLCLHGWGGSKESFTELRKALEETDIEILTPDLPGFGDEPEPDHPFTIDDYARWVLGWLRKNIPNPNTEPLLLLGHSHGGRIAIKLASSHLPNTEYRIPNLFLCASAGIKRQKHLRRIIGITLSKTGKFLLAVLGLKSFQPIAKKLLYKLFRVHDYERASPIMRETLKNVTREDLRPLLSRITVPTDLFWGEDDTMTPLADGHIMEKSIPNATLHIYPHTRHRVHRDKATEIAEAIRRSL